MTASYATRRTCYVPHATRRAKGFAVPAGKAAGVLTWPVRDYDGDLVEPAGCRWADPLTVNWEHSVPVGRGEVVLKALPGDGGSLVTVPVGTTTFAACDADLAGLDLTRRDRHGRAVGRWAPRECRECADDVAPLVLKGVLDGLSAEFTPLEYDAGRRHHVTGRPVMHVRAWELHGWAHCRDPRNDYARLFLDKGFAPRSDTVRKAFGLPARHAVTASVPRSLKAMNDDEMDPTAADPAMAPPADLEPPAPAGPPPVPHEITMFADGAQALVDLADQYDAMQTLDDKTRNLARKIAGQLRKLASLKADHADALQAKLDGDPVPEGEGDDVPADDAPPEDEGADEYGDDEDDGPVEKSFGPTRDSRGYVILKAAYRPRRWKSSEVRDVPAAPRPGTVTMTVAEFKRLQDAFDKLKPAAAKR